MAFFSAYTDSMLEPLRLRVVDALSSETSATLSTNGPGGIQAGFFPCESDGLTLYLLVPASSDVLYNLETETAVIITTPTGRWKEKLAHVFRRKRCPPFDWLIRRKRRDASWLPFAVGASTLTGWRGGATGKPLIVTTVDEARL